MAVIDGDSVLQPDRKELSVARPLCIADVSSTSDKLNSGHTISSSSLGRYMGARTYAFQNGHVSD